MRTEVRTASDTYEFSIAISRKIASERERLLVRDIVAMVNAARSYGFTGAIKQTYDGEVTPSHGELSDRWSFVVEKE